MDLTFSEGAALLVQVAMGISLAACAGLRAFLPLFVTGVAGRLDYIPLTSYFDWLESWPALIIFGVAVVSEILADKLPVVDNFLDALQAFVKPIAGTILAASVLTELTPLQATILGLITGGTVAGGVHLMKAKTRLVSSATTAGVGNPFLSFIEDIGAFIGSLGAVLLPLLFIALVTLAFVVAWLVLRRGSRGEVRPAHPPRA